MIFEAIFTLKRSYEVPRDRIREQLLAVLTLRGLSLTDKPRYYRALDLYVEYPQLSFADVFNVASMEAQGLTEIYSWDTDYDKVPGVVRMEPTEDGGDEA